MKPIQLTFQNRPPVNVDWDISRHGVALQISDLSGDNRLIIEVNWWKLIKWFLLLGGASLIIWFVKKKWLK